MTATSSSTRTETRTVTRTVTSTAAHETLRIRPGTPVLDRGEGELQLGTDHRWSLVLTGLSDTESAWLRDAATRRHRSLARGARRWGVDDARRDEITDLLVRCGYLVPAAAPRPDVTAPGGGTADAAALGALRPDGAGLAVLAARARRTVGLSGLGRIGAALGAHLATAGVGTLVLDDRSPVQVTDLGVGPFRQCDVGQTRERALRAALADSHPRTAVGHELGSAATPDVVVVVENRVLVPERHGRLLGAAVAHLPVVVGEADVVVGPLVLPGRSACAGCVAQHATDADRCWPALATQLREVDDVGGVPQETTLAATAAALAAGQVLAHLDGARPAAVGATIEVSLPEALPRLRPVAPHPRCGCTELPHRAVEA